MILVKMTPSKGHEEVLDMTAEQMIKELEAAMNDRKVAVVEEPAEGGGYKDAEYLRDPQDVLTLDPMAKVTIMPQLVGG